MLVGIVSDTHDNADRVAFAVDRFREAGVDAVVHCGDFVAPFSVTPFDPAEAGTDWTVHAVRGNNDGEWAVADTVAAFGSYHGEFAALEFDGVGVAVYHGTSEGIVDALVASGEYEYVLRGHTHERTHEERGGTVHVNPGGVAIPPAPEPFSVAILDTDAGEVAFEPVDGG
ncbi:MAG: metallophosphoesterase [Halolamina sp.]